jgi:hypothetical protein
MRTVLAYVATMLVVGLLLALLGAWTLERMVSKAVEQAQAARDAHWTAEIATANAQTEMRLRLQAMAAQAADAVARDQIEAAALKIAELEKQNEALPLRACGGLGLDRVKLLEFGPR